MDVHWVCTVAGLASGTLLVGVAIESKWTMVKEREWRGELTHQENLCMSSCELTTISFGVVEVHGNLGAGDVAVAKDDVLDLKNASGWETVSNSFPITRCVDEARQCQKP